MVLLQTVADKTILLKASKYLRGDLSTVAVFITSWLSPLEMAHLCCIQSHCCQLNDKVPVMRNGRKPYVVIIGRLMELTSKGDLRPIHDDVFSASSNIKKVLDKISIDVSDKKLDSYSTGVSITGVPPGSVQASNTAKLSQSKNAYGGSYVAPK